MAWNVVLDHRIISGHQSLEDTYLVALLVKRHEEANGRNRKVTIVESETPTAPARK